MKYIAKHPGHDAEVIETDRISLADMQHHVGGLITTAYHPKLAEAGIDMFANDEGLLIGMQPHLGFSTHGHATVIVGPVILVACDEEGETIGLTDSQIEEGLATLKESSEQLGRFLILASMGR